MLRYLVSLLLFSSVDCTCSNGYEDVGNGNCYKTFSTQRARFDAEVFCEKAGGNLIQPQNAFVNSRIQSEAQSNNIELWLGLTCTGTTKTSCTYSNGDKVTKSSFTNFYPGHPNPSLGNCVYLSIYGPKNGKWFSGKCTAETRGYGCQLTTLAPSCGSSYSEFNDFCYKTISPTTEDKAESACQVECGHLTSIQSQDENTFVRDLLSHSSSSYTRIGLQMKNNNTFVWSDGSILASQHYTNFGYIDSEFGNCVAISEIEDVVKGGEWISSECTNNVTSVCKRPKSQPCVSFTAAPSLTPFTVSPSISPSDAFPSCATQFFHGNGTIYSPRYPSNYVNGLECDYVISAPAGYVVFLSLTSHYTQFPDEASNISLYDDVTDTVPFLPRIEYGLFYLNTIYASTTSTMKVKFASGSSNSYKWTADYNAVDIRSSGCNQGVIQAPGTITSPAYSDSYPSQYTCNYRLEASFGQKVQLDFSYFYLGNGNHGDILYVYDGAEETAPLIGTYGNFYPEGINVTSTSHRVLVVLVADEYDAPRGFTATFKGV